MKWKYKEEKSFEERFQESEKVRKKYPDRVPIIVEKLPSSKLPELEINKFLVEKDSTVAQFLCILRKRLPSIAQNETIFFLVNKHIVVLSLQIFDLYQKYADKDNFLYIAYSEESVFGAYN